MKLAQGHIDVEEPGSHPVLFTSLRYRQWSCLERCSVGVQLLLKPWKQQAPSELPPACHSTDGSQSHSHGCGLLCPTWDTEQ